MAGVTTAAHELGERRHHLQGQLLLTVSLSLLLLIPSRRAPGAQAAPEGPANQTSVQVRLAAMPPLESPWGISGKEYRERVTARSGGRLSVKLLFGGKVPTEQIIIERVRSGDLEMGGVHAASLSELLPDLQVLEIPFLFESESEAEFVLDEIFDEVSARLARIGLSLYRYSNTGWHGIGTNFGPVRTPLDLRGRSIRAIPDPISAEVVRSFGATPVEIPVSEMLAALETGRVDGFFHSMGTSLAQGFLTRVKYFTLTQHTYALVLVVAGKAFYESLEPDLRAALFVDRSGATRADRDRLRAMEKEFWETVPTLGVQIVRPSEDELRAFRLYAQSMQARYLKQLDANGRSLLEAIRRARADYKRSNLTRGD